MLNIYFLKSNVKSLSLRLNMRLLTFIEKHLKIYSEFQEGLFQPRSQVGFVLVSSTKSVFWSQRMPGGQKRRNRCHFKPCFFANVLPFQRITPGPHGGGPGKWHYTNLALCYLRRLYWCINNFASGLSEHLPMIICFFFSFSTDNTVIEHFQCLGTALNRYYKGDTIVVYPGRYMLDKAYYLADSLHIVGKGNSSEIVGKSMGSSLLTVYMYI